MQLFFEPEIESKLSLDEIEARHCFNVLRKKSGNIISVVDGKGNCYDCEILIDKPKKNQLKIISKQSKNLQSKTDSFNYCSNQKYG